MQRVLDELHSSCLFCVVNTPSLGAMAVLMPLFDAGNSWQGGSLSTCQRRLNYADSRLLPPRRMIWMPQISCATACHSGSGLQNCYWKYTEICLFTHLTENLDQ